MRTKPTRKRNQYNYSELSNVRFQRKDVSHITSSIETTNADTEKHKLPGHNTNLDKEGNCRPTRKRNYANLTRHGIETNIDKPEALADQEHTSVSLSPVRPEVGQKGSLQNETTGLKAPSVTGIFSCVSSTPVTNTKGRPLLQVNVVREDFGILVRRKIAESSSDSDAKRLIPDEQENQKEITYKRTVSELTVLGIDGRFWFIIPFK